MVATTQPHSYHDLLTMPDDGKRREIIGGDLLVNPAPRRDHQELVVVLIVSLHRFLLSSGRGRVYTHPVDVYLGPHDIVQPDLIAIRHSRLNIYQPEGVVVEPPDLVVEILLPSTRRTDLVRKMALYARSGVPEYWVVDPDGRTITFNVLTGDVYVPAQADSDGMIPSVVIPGLRVDPAEDFARLD